MKNEKRTSLKDIAEKAGVSTSVVSFVLNGKSKQYRISDSMTKRVVQIAKELNYQPNLTAKSLRRGYTKSIGVVLSDISNPFFAVVARHIEDVADKAGYTVLFVSSDENSGKMERQIAGLLNKGVDGLIVVPCEKSETILQKIKDDGIPAILLDRYLLDIDMSYVCLNNYDATFSATNHLISNGYNHIGIIANDAGLMHMRERVRGYKEAMIANGLNDKIETGYVNLFASDKQMEQITKQVISRGVDALVLATNTISIKVLFQIKEMSVRVPHNMGIVGFDGSNAFEFFTSPITYIKQPIEQLAVESFGLLQKQIENNKSEKEYIKIEGSLIVRGSSSRINLNF